MRDQKRTVEQGVNLKLYRHYKCELQQRWMNYYEDKLVDELEGAMKQVDPNRLAVIVLPEAMICDYVTEDEAKENGLRARGYVNPLYEETVRKILGPSVSGGAAAARIISDEDGNKTLLKFTADHGQALLFAGTVWLQTSGISLYYGTKELEYDGIYEKTVNLWDEDVICLHGKESIERNINLEELYAIRNSGGYGIEGKIRLYYATIVEFDWSMNYNFTFLPHPRYWVAFGTYQVGEVVDIESMTNAIEIVYEPDVFERIVTLQNDNTWRLNGK